MRPMRAPSVFGRGKKEGAGEDISQFFEPGFAPVITGQDLNGLAPAVRKAGEWSEYISQQRLLDNFPLDGRPDDREFNHHNDVVRNFWIHTGLLLPNTERKHTSYEWPLHSNSWKEHVPRNYMGNPRVFGPLHLSYHQDNFPGMIIRS